MYHVIWQDNEGITQSHPIVGTLKDAKEFASEIPDEVSSVKIYESKEVI